MNFYLAFLIYYCIWVLVFFDQLVDVEIEAPQSLNLLDEIEVIDSESNILHNSGQGHGKVNFGFVAGVNFLGDGLRDRVNLAKLDPDIGVHSSPISRLDVFALHHVHSNLIGLPLDLWGY